MAGVNDVIKNEFEEFKKWKEQKEKLEEILEDYWCDNPVAEADVQRRRRENEEREERIKEHAFDFNAVISEETRKVIANYTSCLETARVCREHNDNGIADRMQTRADAWREIQKAIESVKKR